MVPSTTSLTGFSGETIWPLGQLRLLVTIGDAEHFTKAWMNFMIVRSPSPYNGIIGRPGIREIQAVPSTAHRMLKFPVNGGVVTIRSTILTPNECATITESSKDSIKKIEGGQENLKVAIHPDFPDQEVALGGTLSIEGRTALCKKRGQASKRAKAIQAEVQKLVEEGIMHEVYYYDWYTKMQFGLKNAGATYQRLVDKAFKKQVGQNLEVYVDDLVIKSHTEAELLRDIEETFRTLRKINMKLNPKKCTFGAVEGMFLGYMVGPEGIKSCPEKIEAVLQLPSPRTIKEVQSLNGKLAGLNRFLSKSPEKSLPLFKTLKKCIKKRFPLDTRSGAGFQTTETTYIRTPHVGGTKAKGRANNVLVHLPRSGPELNYTLMEKLVLALVFAAKSLQSSGAGLILTSLDGAEFTYALRFQFTASNNEAEYEALLARLRIAAQMGVRNVQVSVDSKLVANQVLGTYIAKEENMIKYLEKSIQEKVVAAVVEEERPTWMTPITEYLKDGVLPDDKKEANKLRIKARQYELIDGILYRRSFLRSWLSDNLFKDWCEKLNITQRFASVKHPQSNGLIERVNRSLGEGIKARLDKGNKKWIEEIPHVIWAHRTMIKSSNGDTPFSLTYSTEVVIPAEIEMPTYRTAVVDVGCGVTFKPGDYVYHSNEASHAMDGGKLGPKWEGPYEVTEVLGDGAYKLRSMDGAVLPRTWNIANLKKCYL
ncbi:reverse transcriptase domain-containing protein [Tanacetum coccineum]